MEEEVLVKIQEKPKEVSDKIVVVLVVIAILISVIGTYLVYNKADNISNVKTTGNIIVNNPVSTVGVVGVEIIPKQNQESENK